MSLLLEINPGGVSQPYMVLFPILLQPVLWENSGNVPALVRLLQAYVTKGAAHVEGDKVVNILLFIGLYVDVVTELHMRST